MKYTKEQLRGMGDFEVNKALEKLVGAYCDEFAGLHFPHPDYCNNWDDVMPLVDSLRISLIPCDSSKHWVADSFCELFSFIDENPKRAAACCLILVLQEMGK